MKKSNGKIPRNVLILGLVSFCNDLASEMIYPIVPLFLTTVLHTSIPVIGLIDGIAEGTASLSKYLFGKYSDYIQKRKPFVVTGYSFGVISKVLIGLASTWPLVLFARIVDRLGKGIRTAPRDSLLLENTTPENRGYLFGFHRAFDSLGAVFGPLLALLILYGMKENIRATFFIATIPGIIAVLLLLFLVKEKQRVRELDEKQTVTNINPALLDTRLKMFLLVSFLFSLGNSSDSFLLLYAKNLGLSTILVVLTYVLYNISQTVFATPAGILSDKLGAGKVYAGGLLVFALVYIAFGMTTNAIYLWILFPIYGIYIAATDGVSKAFIADFISPKESGTYFGAYYTLTAVGSFFASYIGGLLWTFIAPQATFFYGGILSLAAFLVFTIYNRKQLRYGNR